MDVTSPRAWMALQAMVLAIAVVAARADDIVLPVRPLLEDAPAAATNAEKGRELIARRSPASAGTSTSQSRGLPASPIDTTTVLLLCAGMIGFLILVRRMRGGRAAIVRGGFGAVEVLSRTPLSGRQQLCLVRLGRSLLLLGVTPDHVRNLATVSEPMEVATLVAAAESARRGSLSSQFVDFLKGAGTSFEGERSASLTDVASRTATAPRAPAPVALRGVTDRIRAYAAPVGERA